MEKIFFTQAELDEYGLTAITSTQTPQYQRDRQTEYPNMGDLLVAIAEKLEGNSNEWDRLSAQRLAVKAKYPKPQ